VKVVVCIPTLAGTVSAWTLESIMRLYPSATLGDEANQIIEIADTWLWPYDLARVRSRAARKFLAISDATHLFFVDADIVFPPMLLPRLLKTGLDVVSAPYPRRDIRWDLAFEAARAGEHPEHAAYEYVYRTLAPLDTASQTFEVAGVGMGATLISRRCIEEMHRAYGTFPAESPANGCEDLRAWDNHPTQGGETVMLFAMQWGEMNGKRHLFGEDLSFCNRWRAIGGKCHLYVGPGAPASHYAGHYFRGTPEGFAKHAARGDSSGEPRKLPGGGL